MAEDVETDDPIAESLHDFRKFLTLIVAVFTFLFITFGLYVFFTRSNDQREQKQIQHALEQVVIARSESRKIQCDKENEFKIAHNNGFQHVIDVFQSIADKSQDPATQEAAKEQLKIFKGDLVELRDCTPEGIDKYYNS